MEVDEALRHIQNSSSVDVGRFYSTGEHLSLGKGKIYDSVIFPFFDSERGAFLTVAGIGYVLTHECDVDANNARMFNSDVLICPIIPLENMLAALKAAELSRDQLVSFLTNLGARNIFRLIYIPSLGNELEHGGVLYLNQITNAPTDVFSSGGATPIGALTGYSLGIIEISIENHLLRPKSERLAFMPFVAEGADPAKDC